MLILERISKIPPYHKWTKFNFIVNVVVINDFEKYEHFHIFEVNIYMAIISTMMRRIFNIHDLP